MALTLTFPERVTEHNIEKLKQRVLNGEAGRGRRQCWVWTVSVERAAAIATTDSLPCFGRIGWQSGILACQPCLIPHPCRHSAVARRQLHPVPLGRQGGRRVLGLAGSHCYKKEKQASLQRLLGPL